MTKKEVTEYFIGVDYCNKSLSASYCLAKKQGGVIEVVKIKTYCGKIRTIEDKVNFYKEVKYLSKFFNAKVLEEK